MMMSHIQTETSEVKCHVASDKAQSRGRGGNRRKQDEQINNTNNLSDDTEEEKKKELEKRRMKKKIWFDEFLMLLTQSFILWWRKLNSEEDSGRSGRRASLKTVMSLCPTELWCHRVPMSCDVTASHCCFILTHVRDRRRRLTDGFIHVSLFLCWRR